MEEGYDTSSQSSWLLLQFRAQSSILFRYPDSLSEKIVKDIMEILRWMSAPVAKTGLVGTEPIVEYIIKFLLHLDDFNNVHTIGILGMGGIGKTTITEALFNNIKSQFHASYFARDVREKSSNNYTLTLLRRELLSTILEDQNSNIDFNFTKERLGRKRVLIVFDDVMKSTEIESLIGDLNWLGGGSRIIITTRDKQVLKNCGVDEHGIYKIGGLSPCNALQLFCTHAFRNNCPKIDYSDLSLWFVNYSKGVPLALKVLGCYLFDRPKEFWEGAIKKLERVPHKDIYEVLKLSFDGLDENEKDIFLDIACFLKGESKNFAEEFFDACNFHPKVAITILVDKCLVIETDDNKITMHDLLQEMGRKIVQDASMNDLGRYSRLWHHEDIQHVLEANMGAKKIQGICLDMSKLREIINLQPRALAKMHQLRFFKLYNLLHYEENNINKVHVSECLNSISVQLRYLCWDGCPLKSLKSNFRLKNLVALNMRYSNVEQLPSDDQLWKLKHIDLSYSRHLKVQDLSLTPNVACLILEGCTSMVELSSTVLKSLPKLIILNLKYCKSLHTLPTCICLESLKKIILSCCSSLKTYDPEMARNIEELYLDETAIKELPPTITNLSKLVTLNLKNCSMLRSLPSEIFKLKSLEHLNLSGCSKLEGLLDDLGLLEAEDNFGHFEEEEDNLGHFEAEEDNLGHCVVEEDYLGHCVVKEDNLGHSEADEENLRHSEAEEDNFGNSEAEEENLRHSEAEEESVGHPGPEDSLRHSELEEDNLGHSELEAFKVLKAERIGKIVVPSSIVHSRRLMELSLTNCCIKELPNDFGQLSSLESLLLGRNYFESIPTSIINLSKLYYLDLSFCERLKSLPKLPHELKGIDAHNCTSLKEVSNLPRLLCDLECLDAYGWTADKVSSSLSTRFPKTVLGNVRVNFSNCYRMDQNVLEEVVADAMLIHSKRYFPHLSASICFSGIEIPNWFNFQSEGSSVTHLEESARYGPYGSKICRFAVCAIVEFQNYHNEGQGLVVGYDYKFRSLRRNWTEVRHRGALKGWDYGTGPEFVDSHHVFLGFDFRPHSRKNRSYLNIIGVTIQFYVEDLNAKRIGCCNVKKCGAYFIYDGERIPIKVTPPFDKKVDKEKEKEKEKEETHSKRLKISYSFKGESSSR
ncbi:disease resistance-like protein DSC1 isoform X2 [Pistacia vera]|uniref:disease resistance-like protein DSC1 isoform X2 n=1 Tax=Pistacia vera TaxID=55513 RepID=UPI0012632B82|nr:disease resistance-like protein DSC1 isoform X2 [Pistacia vera]